MDVRNRRSRVETGIGQLERQRVVVVDRQRQPAVPCRVHGRHFLVAGEHRGELVPMLLLPVVCARGHGERHDRETEDEHGREHEPESSAAHGSPFLETELGSGDRSSVPARSPENLLAQKPACQLYPFLRILDPRRKAA